MQIAEGVKKTNKKQTLNKTEHPEMWNDFLKIF